MILVVFNIVLIKKWESQKETEATNKLIKGWENIIALHLTHILRIMNEKTK